jgi:hypothetical protein
MFLMAYLEAMVIKLFLVLQCSEQELQLSSGSTIGFSVTVLLAQFHLSQ